MTPHCVGPILHPENLLIMGSVPLKAFQTHVLQAPESLTPSVLTAQNADSDPPGSGVPVASVDFHCLGSI